MTTFDHRAVYCSRGWVTQPLPTDFTEDIVLACDKEILCPHRKRFENCREDRVACKCVCPGEGEYEKSTPRCDNNNNAICSDGLRAVCKQDKNYPVCYDGKIVCHDKTNGAIDLVDSIECK
jgi:hypothetical protein